MRIPGTFPQLRALLIAASIVALATGRLHGADSDASANAAMKYWQAFALLPALSPEQEKLVQNWNQAPLDAAVLKLIDQSQGSREYLFRGAKLAKCDWSLDYEDGIFLRIPYAAKALQLAKLTALHARREFSQGHWDEGWLDISALLKLAHHVETEPVMIVQLVGYAIEGIAIDAAAPYLKELKSALPPNAAAGLAGLPAEPTLGQLLEKERQVGPLWLIGRLKSAEQQKPGAWQAIWKETIEAALVGSEGAAAPNRDAFQSIDSFDKAVKSLNELLPLYDELIKLSTLPPKEFDAQYPEFAKRAKASGPLAEAFAPNLDKFEASRRKHQAKAALFQTAVAIVQGGQDKLGASKDPFGDGPFEYRATDKGFELTSKLVVKGRPLSLTVGQAK